MKLNPTFMYHNLSHSESIWSIVSTLSLHVLRFLYSCFLSITFFIFYFCRRLTWDTPLFGFLNPFSFTTPMISYPKLPLYLNGIFHENSCFCVTAFFTVLFALSSCALLAFSICLFLAIFYLLFLYF